MQSSSAKPPIIWLNVLVLGLTFLVAVTVVPWYGLTYGYDLFEWTLFFIFISYCELSITAGYHRLWSHKAYKAHPVLRVIFALGGAFALQNNCLHWAADHRRHHRHVDDNDKDPYSAGRGLWFSHIGWMLRDYESGKEDFSNIKDLLQDPILQWQKKYYLPLVLLMNIGLPGAIGYFHGDIWGSLLLLGFLRLVLSQHFTYLINSAAHKWGRRTYATNNSARDNGFIALLTYGEGYHNFHHAFAWDYRNGVKWWHYDPTKWLIKCCSWFGLTYDLRACSAFRLEKARLDIQYSNLLKRCEKLMDPNKWRQQLEGEYEAIMETLHSWSSTRREWYQAKSKAIHDKWDRDRSLLKERYQELCRELRVQRKNWKSLQNTFQNLQCA